MEVLSSARKHGMSDDDIRHAVNNAIAAITAPDQPDFTMVIGPNTSSHLLEIGVLSADERLRDSRNASTPQVFDHDRTPAR